MENQYFFDDLIECKNNSTAIFLNYVKLMEEEYPD